MRALTAWRENGLARYLHGVVGTGRMTPWQEKAHRDPARFRAIIKANQVGGSRWMAAENWMQTTGTHPWRQMKRDKGLFWIFVANWDNAYKQVCANLMVTCPREMVDWTKTTFVAAKEGGDQGYFVNQQIVLRDGYIIEFRPSSGGTLSAASRTVDGVAIDEPPSRSKWGDILQRVRDSGGPVWLNCTPIDKTQDLTWLKEELEGDPLTGKLPGAPWSIHYITYIPANVPWKTPQQVEEERALTYREEAGQRNDARWEGESKSRVLAGYKAPLDQLPSPDPGPWSIFAGLDWGEVAGHTAGVIGALRVNEGRWPEVRALGEYVSETATTTAEDARGVQRVLQGLGLRIRDVRRWVGDTNTLGKASPGGRVNGAFERELLALAREELARGEQMPEISVEPADKRAGAPDTGWKLLGEGFGRGLIRVDAARCPRLDRALRRWEGTNDGHRHILDGLRYGTYEHLVEHLQPLLTRGGPARLY